jgi:hypothetical protein
VNEGRCFHGRYRLEDRIATGGMGEVWRAHDEVLDRPVAVKVLKAEYAADPAFLDRFRLEARHAAALSHPGIAGVFDYGEDGETAWLVMELVDGEPLSSIIAREAPLSPERSLDILGQAALAVQAAHDNGVVHRDVKPGNLLVRTDGVVKVTDFGIARAVDAVPVTTTGALLGTAHYISPEQSMGKKATTASDVYSLGVVAYECLTGRRPFHDVDTPVAVVMAHQRTDPRPLPESVPAPVRSLVEQALAKDPRRRPGSAGELGRTALAIRELLGETAGPVAQPVRPPSATRPAGATLATRRLTGAGTMTERPPVPGGTARKAEAVQRRAPDASSKRRVRTTLAMIGLAVVVVGALLLRACAVNATVRVPAVAGERVGRATLQLNATHLTFQIQDAPSRTVHRGWVISQRPGAGRRAVENSTVLLIVSSGPPMVTVNAASYVGMPYQTVDGELAKLGVVPRVAYRASQQPAGTVLNVTPNGRLPAGSPVTVTVAQPPAPPPGPGPGHDKHHHGGGGGD